MQITIGNTVLCAGLERNQTGSPMGPANFRASDAPGVVKHDYIGADRTTPEHIKCDAGTISFDVTRIFPTVEDAVQYALIDSKAEDVEGELKFGDKVAFAHAAITARSIANKGCAVAISYTIEG